MRIFLIIIFFTLFSTLTHGQNQSNSIIRNNYITIGYGYYDAIHISIMHKMNKNNYLGTSIGGYITNNSIYIATEIEYLQKLDSLIHKKIIQDIYIDFRLIYWNLNDENYKWNVLSYIGSIGYEYKFDNKSGMKFDIGVGLRTVLSVKRNSYAEIGWPKNFAPNFRIQLYYTL